MNVVNRFIRSTSDIYYLNETKLRVIVDKAKMKIVWLMKLASRKEEVILVRLEVSDRNQFILDNQEAAKWYEPRKFFVSLSGFSQPTTFFAPKHVCLQEIWLPLHFIARVLLYS